MKNKAKIDEANAWAEKWLDAVADGSNAMSQRKLSVVQKKSDLETVKNLAKKRGVHLLQIEDDKGVKLLAASVKPFKVIC